MRGGLRALLSGWGTEALSRELVMDGDRFWNEKRAVGWRGRWVSGCACEFDMVPVVEEGRRIRADNLVTHFLDQRVLARHLSRA